MQRLGHETNTQRKTAAGQAQGLSVPARTLPCLRWTGTGTGDRDQDRDRDTDRDFIATISSARKRRDQCMGTILVKVPLVTSLVIVGVEVGKGAGAARAEASEASHSLKRVEGSRTR